MQSRASEHKAELIESIVRHLHERLPRGEAPVLESFVRQYYDGVAPDDLMGQTADNLYGEALSLWRFARKRAPNEPKLRVYNPRHEEHGWQSTHTVVEIVNDDMPFLVDSVTAALNGMEADVHLVIHPIVQMARNKDGNFTKLLDGAAEAHGTSRESFMHVQVTEQLGERLDGIRQGLDAAMIEIAAAIEDHLLDTRCRRPFGNQFAHCHRGLLVGAGLQRAAQGLIQG